MGSAYRGVVTCVLLCTTGACATSCLGSANANTACRAESRFRAPSTGPDVLPPCPPIPRCCDRSEPSESSDRSEPSESEAIAYAEAFVRAAGYTDTPASCAAVEPVTYARFDVELKDRHDELLPKAYAASRVGDHWTVVFRYNPNHHPEIARSPGPVPWLDGVLGDVTEREAAAAEREWRAEIARGGRGIVIDDETGRLHIEHQDVRLEAFEPLRGN